MTATHMAPPWVAAMQAEADRAQAALTARDIARSAYEDVVGPHPQTHRK
ncbi:hypothetical protein [Brachybacterium sp. AOP3-A1-3]